MHRKPVQGQDWPGEIMKSARWAITPYRFEIKARRAESRNAPLIRHNGPRAERAEGC